MNPLELAGARPEPAFTVTFDDRELQAFFPQHFGSGSDVAQRFVLAHLAPDGDPVLDI